MAYDLQAVRAMTFSHSTRWLHNLPPERRAAVKARSDELRLKRKTTRDPVKHAARLARIRERRAAKWHDPAEWRAMTVTAAYHRAKYRGIPFGITAADIPMPTHCPLLGIELKYTGSSGHRPPNTATLDRIVCAKGYVKGNVAVISHRANRIKSDASFAELEMLVSNLRGLL